MLALECVGLASSDLQVEECCQVRNLLLDTTQTDKTIKLVTQLNDAMAKQQTLSMQAEQRNVMPSESARKPQPKPNPTPSAQSTKPARVVPVPTPVRTPTVNPKPAVQPTVPTPNPTVNQQAKPQISEADISGITAGTSVRHKAFKDGQVTKIEGNVIYVSFAKGEKKFAFPDAFYQGFLSVKKE